MGVKVVCCRCGSFIGVVGVSGPLVDLRGDPLRCKHCADGGIPGKVDKAEAPGLNFLRRYGARRIK